MLCDGGINVQDAIQFNGMGAIQYEIYINVDHARPTNVWHSS
jgi:hypothetical protein